jgi:uncharacterized membrane protein
MTMEPPPPPPPPPAPPPPPPAGGARGYGEFSVGDAISYGWGAYWKNVGPLLLIAVVILAINILFSAIGGGMGSGAGRVVWTVIGDLVGLLLSLGWLRVSLEITKGVRPQVPDLFHFPGFGTFLLASILFFIGAVIGFVLLIVPGIIFVVIFGFYGFVIAERENNVGVLESLQRSADITRGHRWPLFGLGLLLLGINILGLLACFVGVLFTSGITVIAWAWAYRTLSGEPVEYAAWNL